MMNEQDKKIVEDAKRFPRTDFVESLISIIDRLDAENEKLYAELSNARLAQVK